MWFFSARKTAKVKSTRRSPHSHRPRVCALEDRCLLSAGALDPTFGSGAGYVTASLTNSNDWGGSVIMEPNGTLIQSGLTSTTGKHPATTYAIGLIAYNPDGSLDTAFGNAGKVLGPTAAGGSAAVNAVLYPSTDPNGNGGKFLVTGLGGGFAIARYNANGTLDTSFGSSGIARANFGSTLGTYGTTSTVILPNGELVALGYSSSGATAELARFTANGALDTTFGTKGLATAAVPQANALLLQPDGTLVVVGCATQPAESASGLGLANFNGNGTLNSAFGNNGYVTNSSFSLGIGGTIEPIAGSPGEGDIVVIGSGGAGWELARYSPNGSLDSTFGSGGLVHTALGPFGAAVAVQPDGQIVAAGPETAYSALGIARYNPDGTLDSTFGSGGIVTTTIGAKSALGGNAGGVTLQPNGDIVVAASSYNGSKWNFALARYLASEPVIGAFTANQSGSGAPVAMTASNITDGNPNGTISQVTFFYYDSNGTEHVLGTVTAADGSGNWTLSISLPPGTYTLYAQAVDSYGVIGDPVAYSLTVQ